MKNYIISMLFIMLSACSATPKNSNHITFSTKLIDEKHAEGSSCYAYVTLKNNSNKLVKVKKYMKLYVYDSNGNQIAKTSVSIDALIQPQRSAMANKSLVAYGQNSNAICKAAKSYGYES